MSDSRTLFRHIVRRLPGAAIAGILLAGGHCSLADPIPLAESFHSQQVFDTVTQMTTRGKMQTSRPGGAKTELEMEASAEFHFLARRLPAAGRDASALREVREFSQAQLKTVVAGNEKTVQLDPSRKLTVANGQRDAIVSYSLNGALTRETADLLEMPGDPLAILALLPASPVEIGGDWNPPDWALQMLTGVEAVSSGELTCHLDQATSTAAKVKFRGKIEGQRLGTNTTVDVVGAFLFDLEHQYLSQAKVQYTVHGDVGAVNPGLEMTTTTALTRRLTKDPGPLTDELVASIPLDPPAQDMRLVFRADPWGLELMHSRDWHLFQAVFDGGAPVAILRLMLLGSLVAQCNVSPTAPVVAGESTPLDQFEADIRQSLGDRFGEFVSRERLPTDDGRQIFRVEVTGKTVLRSNEGRATVPMTWIYYLVTAADGRQASFVFSVESALLEQLQQRDREIVMSVDFVPVRR